MMTHVSKMVLNEKRTCNQTGQKENEAVLLSGVKPVLEMLKDDPARIDMVFVRRGVHGDSAGILDVCRAAGVRFRLCDGADLDRLLASQHSDGAVRHQGVVARLLSATLADFGELLSKAADAPLPLVVAADQVQDPGNLGTIARTLYALGGAGLVVPKHNTAFLGPGARRAAAGALERLPVSRVTNLSRALDAALDAGFHVYGAAFAEGSVSAFETSFQFPAVLVLGGEEKGLRLQVRKRCEALVHIPMLRAFDSLNVAQAGAILVAECLRQRVSPQ